MPARLCGETRVAGGLYWACWGLWDPLLPSSGYGANTIAMAMRQRKQVIALDPPVVIDPQAIGLQAVGVKMIERNGVFHVLDWVGTNHYPNVADFVEEAARHGVSRRMPSNLRFDLLTSASRLLLVHEKAYLEGRGQLLSTSPELCPGGNHTHQYGDAGIPPMCVRYWWDDLDQNSGTVMPNGREVRRELAGGHSYIGRRRTQPLDQAPFRQPAIFASIVLDDLQLVRDPENQTDVPIGSALSALGVHYHTVDR
jgi:hypothetical protein